MGAQGTFDVSGASERKVLWAAVVVTAALLLMVVFQFVLRFEAASPYAGVIFWGEVVAGIAVIAAVVLTGRLALREMAERRLAAASALEARTQVELLFRMTDMLQSALDYADANAVLRATAPKLLPGIGGALYVFNNSRDRLDLAVVWGWPDECPPSDTISPSQCWALKRGKAHVNEAGDHALHCEHHEAGKGHVLEVPMMARGEVYGLLTVRSDGPDAAVRLTTVTRLVGAVADTMSLALSNIALREKLSTQALRDPLTGLYNRRYMEDALERYANLAERQGGTIAAIMIDLDHFKRLNDEHGHAMGDAVLREVAATMVGAIRPCDVACRYGGEEFIALLPDCGLDEAAARAEVLRARIEGLSDNHGVRVTASFGVAALSETTAKVGDLVPDADAALYRAKQRGRNQVSCAARRSGPSEGPQTNLKPPALFQSRGPVQHLASGATSS